MSKTEWKLNLLKDWFLSSNWKKKKKNHSNKILKSNSRSLKYHRVIRKNLKSFWMVGFQFTSSKVKWTINGGNKETTFRKFHM